jgi:hypothetical protein
MKQLIHAFRDGYQFNLEIERQLSACKEIKCTLFNDTHLNMLVTDNGIMNVPNTNLSKLFYVNP